MLQIVGRNIVLFFIPYRHGTRQTQRESEHIQGSRWFWYISLPHLKAMERSFCLHKSPPLALILRQTNPVPNIVLIFNLMLFCHLYLCLPSSLFPLRSYDRTFVGTSRTTKTHRFHITRPTHTALCLCMPSSRYQSEETVKMCCSLDCSVNICLKSFLTYRVGTSTS
jgi:hypothetical protein